MILDRCDVGPTGRAARLRCRYWFPRRQGPLAACKVGTYEERKHGAGPMLNHEELLILTVAARDDSDEYSFHRKYNGPFGTDYAAVKGLQSLGFMTFASAKRCPLVNDFVKTYRITDEGRAALAASQQ